ncbi:synaptonemal complex protein 2-like [Glossina fuscipes]|uniref:Synaptonemal complex protein 2-like n=1 Tax=Glossina fuscipes TaxID=7396 RepID=A0A9C5ZLX6_9MUSC|nr:synaptonemal complex protein 2-like [Glossina fuscipes]KAI9588687.1 hypothetical protein GQX74_004532 [Glossina fuscipes]
MDAKNLDRKLIKSLNELEIIADGLNTSKLVDASNLRKVLKGFKFLTRNLEFGEHKTFEVVTIWCRLYLRMQSFLDAKNENINAQFEKSTPKVITHMIGCLQCQVNDVNYYYFTILQIIDELLKNMQLTSIKKLADLHVGVISCLWYPINHAGDFNTQVLALKLIWKLLQICDIKKRKEELKAIHGTSVNLAENQLSEMIQKGNMDTFETMARELLNIHNLNIYNEGKVYSFTCQSLRFDKCTEFYRPLNSDKFWVDFNCGPRTMSFKGRYRSSVNESYKLTQVIIKIKAITMRQNALIACYEEKIEFSNTSAELEILNRLGKVNLCLSDVEADRLTNNKHFHENFKINTIDNENAIFSDSDSLHENTGTKKEPTFAEKSDGNNVSFNESNKGNNAIASPVGKEVLELFPHGVKQEKDNNATNTAHINSANTPQSMHTLESKDSSPIKGLPNKRKFFKTPVSQKTMLKRRNNNKTSSPKPKKIKTPTSISKSTEIINLTDNNEIEHKSPSSSRSLDSQTASDSFIVNISNYLKEGREYASPVLPKDQQRANIIKRTNSSNHPKYSAKNPIDVYNIFDEI